MGVAPLNKLYAMMLTMYSFTKQAEARAYYQGLSGFVSGTTNSILLVCSAASFFFGPCIGYFDTYYNVHIHCKVTQIFTIGELGYVFYMTYLLHTNRSEFTPAASSSISRCVLGVFVILLDAILMSEIGGATLGIPAKNQIGEWVAFYTIFFVRYNLAEVMRYKNEVKACTTD